MTVEDRIKSLVDLAQERGYVTYDDVNKTFPDKSFSPDELDEVILRLRNLEIEIVDQTDRSIGSGI